MSAAREEVLGTIRQSLNRTDEAAARAAVEARLTSPARGTVPARAELPHDGQVDLFEAMAIEQAATVARVRCAADIPGAVAEYLKAGNMPPKVRMAPDPDLQALPWDTQPLLDVEVGRAQAHDQVSLTGAFAGIAETGTLMLASGPHGPTTLNFLPETHIVVLDARQIVGPYEDAWDRMRASFGKGTLPRTVNLITGPSRTADIEQTILLGAHGPRRLHIILVEDAPHGATGDGA